MFFDNSSLKNCFSKHFHKKTFSNKEVGALDLTESSSD